MVGEYKREAEGNLQREISNGLPSVILSDSEKLMIHSVW